MTLFRLRQWGSASLWLVPVTFGLAGVGLALGLTEYDRSTPVYTAFDFSSDTATQLLAAIAGAAVAFTGFAARLHPHRLGAAPALPDLADLGPGEPWDVRHAGRGASSRRSTWPASCARPSGPTTW